MIRVLVTGAGGQLGKSLARLSADWPDLELVLAKKSDLDITDNKRLEEVFAGGEFNYCINCAAYTRVDQAEQEPGPAYAVNAEAVYHLALSCAAHRVTLIHLSTDYVFDGKAADGYGPGARTNPINEYGRSKLLGEQHIAANLDRYFIIRTSWLYDREGENFYTAIAGKAGKGEEIRVTDQQLGCPTHVDTVGRFIFKLITSGSVDYGIYHVTDEVPMTWYDFAKKIIEELGLEGKARLVRDKNYRSFTPRPANSVLNRE